MRRRIGGPPAFAYGVAAGAFTALTLNIALEAGPLGVIAMIGGLVIGIAATVAAVRANL